MAKFHWKRIAGIMAAHHWNYADLSRKLGISESHLSDLRKGRRAVSMAMADLMCHVMQVSYDHILIHPTVNRQPSAREVLAMTKLDDQRPWPVAYSRLDDASKYAQWRKERRIARRLESQEGGGS